MVWNRVGAIKHSSTVKPRHLKLAPLLVVEGPKSYNTVCIFPHSASHSGFDSSEDPHKPEAKAHGQ